MAESRVARMDRLVRRSFGEDGSAIRSVMVHDRAMRSACATHYLPFNAKKGISKKLD